MTDEKGLVQGHAYTVIGVKKLSNGVRLVKCRNPWGEDSWEGDWGWKSKKWTPKLLQEAGAQKSKKDGIICPQAILGQAK